MGIIDKLFGKSDEEKKSLAKKLFHKGYARVEMGLPEESIKYLDKALKIYPQFADALNGKGMALSWLGKYGEAIQCFDSTLKINPQFAWCWTQKGIALTEFGRKEEAIKCYDTALKIDPKDDFVLGCKKVTLEKLGRYEGTQKSSRSLIPISEEEAREMPEGERVIVITSAIKLLAKYELRADRSLGLLDEEAMARVQLFEGFSDKELIERANFFHPSTINKMVQRAKLEIGLRNFVDPTVSQKYLRKIDKKINSYDYRDDS